MTLRQQPVRGRGNYILGRWTRCDDLTDHSMIRSVSPSDLQDHIGDYPAHPSAAGLAVQAAQSAFSSWRRTPQDKRALYLERYRDEVAKRREAFTHAIARAIGKPLWEARTEADALVSKVNITLQSTADLLRDRETEPGSFIRHRPIGVCAVLGPFNFPAHLANGHIVPALLAGNTVVYKPSERAPAVAELMAECFDEAGLEPGVFNMVQGAGPVGQALLENPKVDGIMFTGSTRVGRHILRTSSEFPGRMVALEMGGNNAILVLNDADLAYAVREIAFAAYVTAGQRCTAARRVFVHRSVESALLERLEYTARETVVGTPDGPETFLGPVVSDSAMAQALAWAHELEQHCDPIVAHEKQLVHSPEAVQGYYLRPGLYKLRDEGFRKELGDREWFSPLLVLQTCDTDQEMVERANESRFALAAAVFTRDKARFRAIADDLEAGLVNWNRGTVGSSSRLPFGGMKESGNHRSAGLYSPFYCADPVGELHVAEPKIAATPQGLRVRD